MNVSPAEFREIQSLVRGLCGLVLSDDKLYLVRARLESVVRAHGCRTFGEYVGKLKHSSAIPMRDELVEALTTAETSFNRDAHPFAEFRSRILPALAESLSRRRMPGHPAPLARLWSAGCSTGQEPYSLAMAVHDFVDTHPALHLRPEQFPILATDVSARVLNTAKEGRYPDRDVERGLTREQRARFFRPQGDGWIVNDALRQSIEFRRLNFMDPVGGLGPFEVIFCRNVMIYFDADTRRRLCERFESLLVPGGLLILGATESLYGISNTLLSERIGSTIAYRKAGTT